LLHIWNYTKKIFHRKEVYEYFWENVDVWSPNMERVAAMTLSRGSCHPAGVAIIGTEALSFRLEKPSPHLVPRATTYPRAELPTHDLGADHAEAPPTPGTPDAIPSPPAWPEGMSHYHRNAACYQDAHAVHLLEPPLRRPRYPSDNTTPQGTNHWNKSERVVPGTNPRTVR
jgi:hypothetical protein